MITPQARPQLDDELPTWWKWGAGFEAVLLLVSLVLTMATESRRGSSATSLGAAALDGLAVLLALVGCVYTYKRSLFGLVVCGFVICACGVLGYTLLGLAYPD